MGDVEMQCARILLSYHLGLAAAQIVKANRCSGNCKIVSEQDSECKTASGKVIPIFLEVKPAGSPELLREQDTSLNTYAAPSVKTHPPNINVISWKRRGKGSL